MVTRMGEFSLADRTILLTGAGRGIGRALLGQLVSRKARRIIVVGHDGARLRELAAEIPSVDPYTADLSVQARVDGLVTFVRGSADDLSVLINNAGTQLLTDLVDPEAGRHGPALAKEMAVNFLTPIQLAVALLPQMLEKPSAMIVNVTSGLALAPKQSSPVYCAAKAGLRSFTKALRYQAKTRAPHVKVVEALPPLVDTAMTKGRGRAKISPEACAAEIIAGMEKGREAIYVGKTKLLRALQELSPSLADRLMRDG
jgi:uncharacterized oxidoreductase